MEKKKIAFIFFGLFIFGIIIGVSQSKEKILADRQAQEDRKIAAQQRAEAEKQAEEDKKNAKEEKRKQKKRLRTNLKVPLKEYLTLVNDQQTLVRYNLQINFGFLKLQ